METTYGKWRTTYFRISSTAIGYCPGAWAMSRSAPRTSSRNSTPKPAHTLRLERGRRTRRGRKSVRGPSREDHPIQAALANSQSQCVGEDRARRTAAHVHDAYHLAGKIKHRRARGPFVVFGDSDTHSGKVEGERRAARIDSWNGSRALCSDRRRNEQ